MIHRIGGAVLDGVRMTSRTYEGDGVRLTFYFDDFAFVPEVEVPGHYDLMADGQRLGVRRVFCTTRGTAQGSAYLSVKWRDA